VRIHWETRILGKKYLLFFQSMDIPTAETAGVSAEVAGTTEYVLFMDYDNVKDEKLRRELIALQEAHILGDFHVFATNEFGRHVIGLDRMPLREALDVVYNSTCDAVYKRGSRINEYRTWILRALEKGDRDKPKYLYPVESPYNETRLQSQAHAKFLQLYYGAKVRLVNPDGNDILIIEGYKTGSKIHVADLAKKG